MSERITIFNQSTGEILRVCTIGNPMDIPDQIRPGEDWLWEGCDDSLQYVVDGAAVARPTLGLAAETILEIGALLSFPVPTGTVVILDGVDLGVTEAEEPVELTWAEPATLRLHLRPPFPYREHFIKVVVE